METEILKGKQAIIKAADLLKQGQIVAFPTETVYGLGANCYDIQAVRSIFTAKGRPQDNPLIIHIADISDVDKVAIDVPQAAYDLFNAFSPGPLTVILKKNPNIPDEVTAGLDTVGIRLPDHELARELIRECGFPIAAPSANKSTRISPTSAVAVYDDMKGLIPLIIDGDTSHVGIESTIITLATDVPTILRPGAITPSMLSEVIGKVICPATNIHYTGVAMAPGMKYKHYAPLVPFAIRNSIEDINALYDAEVLEGKRVVILARSDDEHKFGSRKVIAMGATNDVICRNVFATMRIAQYKYDYIISEDYSTDELGFSIMNRLYKASGGNIK